MHTFYKCSKILGSWDFAVSFSARNGKVHSTLRPFIWVSDILLEGERDKEGMGGKGGPPS